MGRQVKHPKGGAKSQALPMGKEKKKANKAAKPEPLVFVPGKGSGISLEGATELTVPEGRPHPLADVLRVLEAEIIGQERAIKAIVRALMRAHAGFRDPNRPIAVLFFAGPTGVGKTETVRALAKALHGDLRKMIKIDCSEYAEPHAISRLVGAPPGYIGSDKPPILSKEAVGSEPNRIILFDEIEKAHFRLHNLLLQIMDEGRLTLAMRDKGDDGVVDMTNCIIVLTSNVGATAIEQTIMDNRIGFRRGLEGDVHRADQQIYEAAKRAFQRSFSPEFRNRITEFIVFRPLSRENLSRILQKLLMQSANRFAQMGFGLQVTEAAREWLIEKGVNIQLGVRPLVKTVEKYVETPLAEYYAWGLIEPGDLIICDLGEGGELTFRRLPHEVSIVPEDEAEEQEELAEETEEDDDGGEMVRPEAEVEEERRRKTVAGEE